MRREEAIALIVEHDLPLLSAKQREGRVIDWYYGVSEEDPEYAAFPAPLKELLAQGDEPANPMDPVYEPLLRCSLKRGYYGVLNAYLEGRLKRLGRQELVSGDAEPMERCPCCRYLSLERRYEYEICKVCFWEDDGDIELTADSGPNHMTLQEGRENFANYRVMDQKFKGNVLPDGKERYAR
jgi:hypothetical protein